MFDTFLGRNVIYIIVLLLVLIVTLVSSRSYYKNNFETKQLIAIATGEPTSESFKMISAVAKIVNSGDYEFTIKVVSTGGSIENINLLEENLVEMATVKSDLKISNQIRLVANLYEEVFHFIYHQSVVVNSIEDIKGLRVAIPLTSSGEYTSFIQLANHFGLGKDKIEPIITTWKSATWLFENGDVDAAFRVREANHTGIKKFIVENKGHVEPITQAESIALNFPMYHKSSIPKGSYNGIPPIPAMHVETLGVDKLLVATDAVPASIIAEISSILFTRKRELAESTNIAGLIKVPSENSLIPWHQGLYDFVNKEQPNFIQQNAEFMALILSVVILLGSSFIQFFNRSKQQKLNGYNEQLLSIKVDVEQTHDLDDLIKLKDEHYALVNQIVGDAVQGKITSDGFEFFTFGWESVAVIISEKEKTLRNE